MTTVGACEAKTHLSAPLERAERGETVTIARLVPATDDAPIGAARALERLHAIRGDRASLAGIGWRALPDQGRR